MFLRCFIYYFWQCVKKSGSFVALLFEGNKVTASVPDGVQSPGPWFMGSEGLGAPVGRYRSPTGPPQVSTRGLRPAFTNKLVGAPVIYAARLGRAPDTNDTLPNFNPFMYTNIGLFYFDFKLQLLLILDAFQKLTVLIYKIV